MTTIVIMPGGFHPFHAGHLALYQSAQRAFPNAEVFVAATNDTSERPFPFAVKEKLAKLAGVDAGHFVQVKSPFRAEEVTSRFDPNKDHLIFVRSEKDSTKPPQAGGVKKNGELAYLQPLLSAKKLEPFSKHAYMAYLPTVEFGTGMTSATEIRNSWPALDEQGKMDLVMSLYPKTQNNTKLTQTVIKLLDAAIGSTQGVDETRIHDPKSVDLYFHPDPASPKKKLIGRNIPARAIDMMIQAVCRKYGVYPEDFEWTAAKGSADPFGRVVGERDMSTGGMKASYQARENQPVAERHTVGFVQENPDYIEEYRS